MLLAPAKTPREIVDRLHDEMKKIMADPELRKKIETIGLIPFDTPSIEDTRAAVSDQVTDLRAPWEGDSR